MAALAVAMSKRDTDNLINHSGWGIQYCYYDYIKILKIYGISISMPGKANPYFNAKTLVFLLGF